MRRKKLRKKEMVLLAFISLIFLAFTEKTLKERKVKDFDLKLQAAQKAMVMMEYLKKRFVERGYVMDSLNDPMKTGLIGLKDSPITSEYGSLSSKIWSLNPNFAALFLEFFKELKLKRGNCIAVALTGSFPAINVALYAAIETYGLKPVIISSVSSSSWGANRPGWTWLDMENELFKAGLIHFRTGLASRGGVADIGASLSEKGRALVDSAIKRNDIQELLSQPLQKDIQERLSFYRKHCKRITAFVNIGGGISTIGEEKLKKFLSPGLNKTRIRTSEDYPVKGVAITFLEMGIPVIYVRNIRYLARKYGLVLESDTIPPPGIGKIFYKKTYDIRLVALFFAVYLFFLGLFLFGPEIKGFGKYEDSV